MKIKYLTVRYNKHDIPYIKLAKRAHLTFNINNNEQIEIIGNDIGLKLLSRALLGMSGICKTNGYHEHIDDLYEINNENKSFIIKKI